MRYFDNIEDLEKEVSRRMLGSYFLMFMGLLLTGGIVFYGLYNETLLNVSWQYNRVLMFVTIGFVLLLSFGMYRLNALVLKMLFLSYSALMGVFFIPFMYMFETLSILYVLIGTSAVFLTLSLYGYFTKDDLQGYRKYLFATLIGILVLGLANIFFGNGMLDFLLSVVGLIIFVIYTAVDTQLIKNSIMNAYINQDYEILEKVQVIGALNLYTDFINMFIRLLALFGKRR